MPRTFGQHQRQDNEIASRSTRSLLEKCGADKKTGARKRIVTITFYDIAAGGPALPPVGAGPRYDASQAGAGIARLLQAAQSPSQVFDL